MSAKEKSYLTIEEVVSLPQFKETAVRQDGQLVAYVKQTTDWDRDKYVEHVWIYDRNTYRSYPLTLGDNESSHPR